MAGDPRWELRQALRTTLLAAGEITALVSTRVYDDVPEDPKFPYIVLDTLDMTEEADKTNDANAVTATLVVWSDYRGYKEVEQILSAIYNTLHRVYPTVTGYDVLVSHFVASEEGRHDDGIGRYGTSRFRYLLDPQ